MSNKISGIYGIECTTDNVIYVGQSKDIYYRWRKHRETLKKGNHANFKIQKDFNSLGEQYFNYFIIEKIEGNNLEEVQEKLNILEVYYIDKYKKDKHYNDIYNLTIGGDCELMSDECKKRCSEVQIKLNGKSVYQLDIYGKIIKSWRCRKECYTELGINDSCLYRALKEKTLYKKKWYFINEDDYNEKDIKLIMSKESKQEKYLKKIRREVYQIDFNGEILNKYDSLNSSIKNTGFDGSGISNCLNHKYKTYKGCIWYYVDDYSNFDINKHIGYSMGIRRIGQYDLEGKLVKIWKKLSDVGDNGYSIDCVGRCVLNKSKTHKKFKWMYLENLHLEQNMLHYDSITHKRINAYEV